MAAMQRRKGPELVQTRFKEDITDLQCPSKTVMRANVSASSQLDNTANVTIADKKYTQGNIRGCGRRVTAVSHISYAQRLYCRQVP
jgi:hypothetical protein